MKQNFKRGFTLIEILVASTILVMVLIMVSATFGMSTKWQKQIKENQAVTQSARVAIGKITEDLRTAKSAVASTTTTTLDITNNDGTVIKYAITGQTLTLDSSELIDSNKVLVKTGSTFTVDNATGLSTINFVLSPFANTKKETTFKTSIKVGEFNQ